MSYVFAYACAASYNQHEYLIALKSLGWRPLPAVPKAVLLARGNTLLAAFRGTKLTDSQDLADDAALISSTEDDRPRFVQARRWLLSVARMYPNAQLIVTGHSLGGSIALACLYRVPNISKVHAFNPYVSNQMLQRSDVSNDSFAMYRKATLHLVLQDPINARAFNMKQATQEKRLRLHDWLNPHALANWLEDGPVNGLPLPMEPSLQTYPPGPMTSKTSQGCIASTSSEATQYGGQVEKLFDWQPTGVWVSAVQTGQSVTTVLDGKAVVGNWAQLQMDRHMELVQYSVTTSRMIATKYPREWSIAASSDGVTWTRLDYQIDAFAGVPDNTVTTRTFNCTASQSDMTYFRLIVTQNYGDKWFTEVGEWRLFARPQVGDTWG